MSKSFLYIQRKRFLPQVSRRGLRRVAVCGTAIVMVAAAAWCMSGQHVLAAQAGKGDKALASIGNAKRGKELYVKDGCYECHSYMGEGGAHAAPRIAPDPLTPEAIAAYIRKPAGKMPPYTSKLVPDQDVADIYAYLKTVPDPTDIKNVPTFIK